MPILDDESALYAGGALLTLVILAFLIERGLAIVFDHPWFEKFLEGKGFKPIMAFSVSYFICWYYDFDVIAALMEPGAITTPGLIITAAIVAGGSAAAMQLVQNIWGLNKESKVARREIASLRLEAQKKELEARIQGVQAASSAGTPAVESD